MKNQKFLRLKLKNFWFFAHNLDIIIEKDGERNQDCSSGRFPVE